MSVGVTSCRDRALMQRREPLRRRQRHTAPGRSLFRAVLIASCFRSGIPRRRSRISGRVPVPRLTDTAEEIARRAKQQSRPKSEGNDGNVE